MRLVQFGTKNDGVLLGAQDGEFVVDLRSAYAYSLTPGRTGDSQQLANARVPQSMEQFLNAGDLARDAANQALQFARSVRGDSRWESCEYKLQEVKLYAPLLYPAKIICIGANYKEHQQEANLPSPTEPVFFSKYRNAITGPMDPILLPSVSEQVDWEAELVAVIGRHGHRIAETDAMNYVVGYTVGNDISARDWQNRRPFRQWMMGKTFDTFLPLGPALVTADEVTDP